jgi:hypothetical protein
MFGKAITYKTTKNVWRTIGPPSQGLKNLLVQGPGPAIYEFGPSIF